MCAVGRSGRTAHSVGRLCLWRLFSNRWLDAEPDRVKRGEKNERKYSADRGSSDKGVR
jgi:hypothetical protein